jgi:hypothetical protein
MPSTDSASHDRSVADPVEAAASKSENENDKQKKINDWVSKTSLDDVVFSETEWIKLGRNDEQKTPLQSIKGSSPSQLTVTTLKKLCVQFRISGYKDKPKHVLCELIVNAAKLKNLAAAMYPVF